MLVSIIIPIYNVAQYIEKCLWSVMQQTYREMEVLLVDDSGTDDSIDIVRAQLGGAEDTVKGGVHYKILHHDENRGLSAARNTGLAAAQGEWVYFLDSDDWIEEDCIERLVEAAMQEEGIEMSIGQLETLDEEGNRNVKLRNGEDCPSLQMAEGVYAGGIMEQYLQKGFFEMAWNKLVKRDFLKQHGLKFKEGLIHEDTLWSFCCASQLKKIAVVDKNKILYHYLVRQDSIMSEL